VERYFHEGKVKEIADYCETVALLPMAFALAPPLCQEERDGNNRRRYRVHR
jgi:hypothetical protein